MCCVHVARSCSPRKVGELSVRGRSRRRAAVSGSGSAAGADRQARVVTPWLAGMSRLERWLCYGI